jgi:uncharacterized membrane protein YfcA
MELLILLSMGALAGTLAGLLGIGGGVIIVPVLAMVFQHQGVAIDVLMHVSIGTSLATIVVTSLSSIRAHQKRGAIDWSVFRRITPGIIVGGFLGSVLADAIPGEELRVLFAIFMFLVATQMMIAGTPAPHRKLPPWPGMLTAGVVIGAIASLMGVGGGAMSVPFMTWCNVHIRQAVATSAAIGFPIALAGAAGFMITGWENELLPPWSAGYVNLPAFTGIVVASILFAPLGAKLAHTIPPTMLKRTFAVLLYVLGTRMLLAG